MPDSTVLRGRPVRWLVVVRRDRKHLYLFVRERFARRARVILDRRYEGERRQLHVPVDRDRRSGKDRRQPLTMPEETMWRQHQYRIVYRTAGFPSQEDKPGSDAASAARDAGAPRTTL